VNHWLPLLDVTVAAAVGVGLRGWLHYRRTGSWGVVLFRDRQFPQLTRDLVLVVAGLALIAQAAFAAWRFETVSPLFACPWPIGASVALVGLVVMSVAQLQMGDAWRIGIDRTARPGLVSHGLYRWSRNPIYVGLLLNILGYALLLPTPLSFAALLVTVVGIRSQVLVEEQYLCSGYGEAFLQYSRHVGRFVPGLGRLRSKAHDDA
jgi:protein-S-isoprenylcysteine O-methyltransferase Ste14